MKNFKDPTRFLQQCESAVESLRDFRHSMEEVTEVLARYGCTVWELDPQSLVLEMGQEDGEVQCLVPGCEALSTPDSPWCPDHYMDWKNGAPAGETAGQGRIPLEIPVREA